MFKLSFLLPTLPILREFIAIPRLLIDFDTVFDAALKVGKNGAWLKLTALSYCVNKFLTEKFTVIRAILYEGAIFWGERSLFNTNKQHVVRDQLAEHFR